jgi:phage N-6-adenine-methyltransferase
MAPTQRPYRSKQNYETPRAFLDATIRRLGIANFAWDLAAEPKNAVVSHYYTQWDNGLDPSVRWAFGRGAWGWLNPEFTHISPWVERAYREAHDNGANTAVLIPASVGANWWRDFVHEKAHVLLLNGRLTFNVNGQPVRNAKGQITPYPKDCALLLYSPEYSPCYDVWTWTK